jgi:RNA-directed DNA polymerase
MNKSKAQRNLMMEWRDIPWRKLERKVYKLQKRIYKASQRGDVKAVRRLQKTLMKSWSAKAIAVRKVTQDNAGKKTAGIDGIKSLTPKARIKLVASLKISDKANPTRRVWIPKPGKDEKRPLGIPTMKDRALQALITMALEPEWEARFEPNSYGFRPGRSCHDAMEAIFCAIRQQPKWVLDADISKCFAQINHKALLEKLNTFPTIRRQIRAWLKAGVMDNGQFFETSEGTPQGGVISPLLANIALHGMEERIKQFAETLKMRYPNGKLYPKQDRRNSVSLIRYADDFVIMHKELPVVEMCREIITDWLKGMGLELKPSKTTLVHTLDETYNGKLQKPGFNFLGFNVRQHRVGKYSTGKNGHGIPLGFKTIITPSSERVKVHYEKVASIIDAHKSSTQEALIAKLNPVIRGWANYYSTKVSKDTYDSLDRLMYIKLRVWAERCHHNKPSTWISRRYWKKIGDSNWTFATANEENNPIILRKYASTPIKRHTKVKGEASPYDGNLVYWCTRMGEHPEMDKRVAKLLKEQSGKCPHCGLTFRESDVMEIDHIIPKSKGGKDNYDNLQLLHRHCHDTKTSKDVEVYS